MALLVFFRILGLHAYWFYYPLGLFPTPSWLTLLFSFTLMILVLNDWSSNWPTADISLFYSRWVAYSIWQDSSSDLHLADICVTKILRGEDNQYYFHSGLDVSYCKTVHIFTIWHLEPCICLLLRELFLNLCWLYINVLMKLLLYIYLNYLRIMLQPAPFVLLTCNFFKNINPIAPGEIDHLLLQLHAYGINCLSTSGLLKILPYLKNC